MDDVARHNKSRWEALAKAGIEFSRPWLVPDRDSARQKLDPQGLLGEVEGKKVLCLASGGGQQSVGFALLGADVTVLDLCETQLERDRQAASDYGISVNTVSGDMRDLSALKRNYFDIVWQPPSINNVPECRKVIEEVSRVLKQGGFYYLEFGNPYTMGIDERSWDGKGYPLHRPYIDGEEIIPDYPDWEIWQTDGNCALVEGPKLHRHTFSAIINSLIDCGFVILRFWEKIGSDSKPGTWGHFTSIAPATLGFWCRLGMSEQTKED